MKVVILAGGRGTRLSEETAVKPKPLVTIGGRPMLWHIMKIYAAHGYTEFVICCGYKGHLIKQYFLDYYMQQSDIKVEMKSKSITMLKKHQENWKITFVNTGLNTKTAGRLLQVRAYLDEAPFLLTYGDGVSDVNISELVNFHNGHKKAATITIARPAGRFGMIDFDRKNSIQSFREKNNEDQAYVNAGFAVMNPEVFNYLGDGSDMLETAPYESMSKDGQMKAFCCNGFWYPMDTLRDRMYLEDLWNNGQAPWKIWKNS